MTTLTTFDPAVLIRAGFPALGRRFVLWRVLPPRRPGGKPVKLPCSVMGRPINTTDSRRWVDFETGVRLARRHNLGLGVALGWGLAGLDLDNCIDSTGTPSTMASTILRHFPTYVERSPSRAGVKAYFHSGAFVSAKRDDKGIELYGGLRWFALTGEAYTAHAVVPIADCTAAAHSLVGVLRPPPTPRLPRPPARPAAGALARLQSCEPFRERPAHLGGTIYSLGRCPFTGEHHHGGGPYAIAFSDGGLLFRCDRSSHGPQRELMRSTARIPRGRLL
jgi:hypothetical protein